MAEYIERQAAIDECYPVTVDGEVYEVVQVETLIGLPSVQPERRTGEWKPFDRTWGRSIYHCTACGEAENCPTEMGRVMWRFCPNCGARMEGDSHATD